MFNSDIMLMISFTSEYPEEHPHDDGRFRVVCEFAYGALQTTTREFTLVGKDDLEAFMEVVEAIPMVKIIKHVRKENGYTYLEGSFTRP